MPGENLRKVCACALIKTAVKLREKLLEGNALCNGVARSFCNLLQKVELSSTSCNTSRNNKNCKQPMLHCNSPATCVATTLRDKLLRKLCSVTYLTSVNKYCFLRFCFPLVQSRNTTVGLASDAFHKSHQKLGKIKVRNGRRRNLRNHIEIEKFHVCPNYEPWATLKHLVLFKPFTDESKCDFI